MYVCVFVCAVGLFVLLLFMQSIYVYTYKVFFPVGLLDPALVDRNFAWFFDLLE